MIIRPTLRLDEMGMLAGLLACYHSELIRDAIEGAKLDEDPHDAELRDINIHKVNACLAVISEDLHYRLTQ